MEPVLDILHLEDDPLDSELVMELLRAAELPARIERVDTLAGLDKALQRNSYSLILSDYSLPGVDAQEALKMARRVRPEIPFVFMSGVMGEDLAIDMLKQGASDYVLKQRTARLVPAVRRAIQEAQEQSRRKRVEEALRQSEERYRTLFNTLIEGFCIIEVLFDASDRPVDCRFVEINPAFEKQTGLSDAQGKRMRELAPENEAHWFEIYGKVALTGEPVRFVNEAKALNRWYDVSAYRVAGRDSRKVAILFNDITERKRAEEALAQAKAAAEAANAAKDQFLASLSHELRTPLTPVLMISQLLRDDERLPEDARMDMDTIRHNISLEARLIDDLLDLTRIARGKIHLKLENVDVHRLIREALNTCCDGDFLHKKLRATCDLAAGRSTVCGDATRLEQVFWNLIKNAIKFTPEAGEITVRTRSVDDHIQIQVIDTGVGIEPGRLASIFNAFEQGGSERTRQFGGLGLGLTISKGIVDLHHGRIGAASDGPGQGTTMTVELPVVADADAAQGPAGSGDLRPSVISAPAANKSILLVEDHGPSAVVIRRLLVRWGYEVELVASVHAAKEQAAKRSFDLVISDLGLPDGNGHDLMAWLHREHNLHGIALSGYGMDSDVEKSLAAGFIQHLTKPVDFEQLRCAIARAFE